MNSIEMGMTPEMEPTPKRPFSDTVEFVRLRLEEIKNFEESYQSLEAGATVKLPNTAMPQFSKDPIDDAIVRNIVGLYCGTDLNFPEIGQMMKLRSNYSLRQSQARNSGNSDPELNYYYYPQTGNLIPYKENMSPTGVRESFVRGIKKLHETASEDLKQLYPLKELTLGKPAAIKISGKPNNKLGDFLQEFRSTRNYSVKKFGRKIGLAGISSLTRTDLTNISLYSLTQILENIESFDCTQEELDELGNIVTDIIQLQLETKGKLYERTPPSVPRSKADDLACATYTPTQLARSIAGENKVDVNIAAIRGRIISQAQKLNFSTVMTEGQAMQLVERIREVDEKRAEGKKMKSEFGWKMVNEIGISESLFFGQKWTNRENGFPNVEEFGYLLESSNLTDDKREAFANLWLSEYRERLPVAGKEYINEFRVTRQAISHHAKRLDPEDKLSNWEKIEAIRDWREPKDGLRGKRRGVSRRTTISSLAREYGISFSTMWMRGKSLGISDLRHLSGEDILKLKKYSDNPPKRGRKKKH